VMSAYTHSIVAFTIILIPLSLGMGFGMPTISSLVSRSAGSHEQGRVQGAASAIESLSRTLGPVWGALMLQRYGEAAPYLTAALFMMLTLVMTVGYRAADHQPLAVAPPA
jgi:MFS transporter, DHA1 family, tetracycline resistance protein